MKKISSESYFVPFILSNFKTISQIASREETLKYLRQVYKVIYVKNIFQ